MRADEWVDFLKKPQNQTRAGKNNRYRRPVRPWRPDFTHLAVFVIGVSCGALLVMGVYGGKDGLVSDRSVAKNTAEAGQIPGTVSDQPVGRSETNIKASEPVSATAGNVFAAPGQSGARFDGSGKIFSCSTTRIIDGDTFDCGKTRIRLQGIDSPEYAGHCRPGRRCTPGDPEASTRNLKKLVKSGPVRCQQTDTDVYGRTVARCAAGEVDLSCAQVASGHAVYRYAYIRC